MTELESMLIDRIKLYKTYLSSGRMFKVFFEPDPACEDWDVGMKFQVISVNRVTGEITFILL